MSSYAPLSADGADWGWSRLDGSDFEQVSVRWDNEAWTTSGRLTESRVEYVLRTSPLWSTRQLLLFRDLDEPDLWLGTDGQGRWGEVNGAHRPDLDGVTGLHLDDSVFSLAIQIAQLPLEVGDRAEVPLAHINTDALAVTPTRWWFERAGSHRWVVERVLDRATPASDSPESVGGDDRMPSPRLEFDVDEHGIVVDVVDMARRS